MPLHVALATSDFGVSFVAAVAGRDTRRGGQACSKLQESQDRIGRQNSRSQVALAEPRREGQVESAHFEHASMLRIRLWTVHERIQNVLIPDWELVPVCIVVDEYLSL
jgi:hypothetical protein